MAAIVASWDIMWAGNIWPNDVAIPWSPIPVNKFIMFYDWVIGIRSRRHEELPLCRWALQINLSSMRKHISLWGEPLILIGSLRVMLSRNVTWVKTEYLTRQRLHHHKTELKQCWLRKRGNLSFNLTHDGCLSIWDSKTPPNGHH